jgi:tRNA(Arg) A34 adenosine deaminase TadA
MDASCHAEINAIRAASRKLKTFDLSGCRIYSTCEPCPMCFSAIHWARIDKVIYASTLKDAVKTGFNELKIKARLIKSMGKSGVVLKRMRDFKECRKLFNDWDNSARKRFY